MFAQCFLILSLINVFVIVRCKQNIGDLCTIQTTENLGTCRLLNDCPQALEDIFIQTCESPGLVCCQNTDGRVPGTTSKQKCREYSKYYVNEQTAKFQTERNQCGYDTKVATNTSKQPAATKEFPHVVLLGYGNSTGHILWNCLGAIISEQYILTAAHCVRTRFISETPLDVKTVKVGITDITDQQEYDIAERITHPDYKPIQFYNDIALLKLEKPIKLGPYVRPACLTADSEIIAKKALAVGWTKPNCGNKQQLIKESLDFYNHTVCSETYSTIPRRSLPQGIVDDIQFCAGSRNDSSCEIISGSPLQIIHDSVDAKCMYDIVGVASFGKAFSLNPDVYVRVSHYIKWIEDIVWPHKS